jgi:putative oxidoreductase
MSLVMKKLLSFFAGSSPGQAWGAVFLIRIMVGWVFVFAGIRKFTEPGSMGAGRFAEMGLPWPEFLGPWVGFWEIAGGVMVLLGFLTRAGAIPLIVVMIVAILTTKMPELRQDLASGLHASRLDISLLLGSLFLLIAGGGRFAIDRFLRGRR